MLPIFALLDERRRSRRDDDEIIHLIPSILENLINARETGARIPDYVENVIIPLYSDKDFKRHFRLSRSSMEELYQRIGASEQFQKRNEGGREMVPIEKQLLIFMWFAATKECIFRTADRFNHTESCINRCLRRVMNALLEKLLNIIAWPTGDRVQEVIDGFKAMKDLCDCIGAIDGSHIRITARKEDNDVHINRKRYPSIQLQCVCDHSLLFTDCYCGWPGSVHDARVFANSDLFQRIKEDQPSMFPGETFIVGDSAYRLETFCMTPYKDLGGFTRQQKRYNYVQSATRTTIERAFGHLKSRFRRLELLEFKNIEDITKFIMSCCIMHNFCILEGNRLGDHEIDFEIIEDQEINNYVCYGSASKDAERKRSSIAEKL